MKGRTLISRYKKYDEDFKKSLVNLYHGGKTQSSSCKEYGISQTTISRWIKLYSEIEESGALLAANQVIELLKQKAASEEKNLISKKAIATFMPHATND
ncbi:transposase [Enterococcus sp. DIV0086]|uniref:transposase n=1 Tax=Enterococcus sp. DIV0086 TaxID=2774655 RepID=UPI003D2A5DD0